MSPNPFAGAVDLAQHMQAKQRSDGLPDTDDLTKSINLLDSEVNEIAEVYEIMSQKAQGPVNYADFDREFKQRLEDKGLVADILWYHTNEEGVKMPEVVIKRRTERREFDHDRMVHEVTHDVLGFNEGGTIKVDKAMFERLEKGDVGGDGHRH